IADPNELQATVTNVRMWGTRERLTFDEVAAAARVDVEVLRRFWRAAGFAEPEADARVLTPRDIELFERFHGGMEFIGEDVLLQLVRVIGAAAARVAEAALSAFVVNVLPDAIEADPSGVVLAQMNELSVAMLDDATDAFDVMLRHNIERGFRPFEEFGGRQGIDLQQRSIGFADLVGSTAWTQGLEMRELADALADFDAIASETVVACGGRVVKTIGDEVMFVANEPAGAVEVALALVDAFDEHPVLPPVRAGVASGGVVARDGDFSGPVVNLAARAVKLARPSSVLVDEATQARLPASIQAKSIGRRTLKGFPERTRLFAVSRRAADAG
ncbi:MAG TPA: adenylate/guanylate cyclase domain-containing protein, partial [Acidimicrobiia bacterium]|nr:adenylate/guanylate cyclase domain-containing protein [Acidimicrobiia bacterium]